MVRGIVKQVVFFQAPLDDKAYKQGKSMCNLTIYCVSSKTAAGYPHLLSDINKHQPLKKPRGKREVRTEGSICVWILHSKCIFPCMSELEATFLKRGTWSKSKRLINSLFSHFRKQKAREYLGFCLMCSGWSTLAAVECSQLKTNTAKIKLLVVSLALVSLNLSR